MNQTGLGSCPEHYTYSWNEKGVYAEILEPHSSEWKKGKMRMRVILEFCPDEPEEKSPEGLASEGDRTRQNDTSLDDIKQTIS